MRTAMMLALLATLVLTAAALAAPTENLGLRVLPAPAQVTVDGKFDDWDLTGGIFICDDPETQRERFAIWYHAMCDAENLYILARWTDEAPMNNPGVTVADPGFAGDCLQFRTITAADTPDERTAHFTAWRGKDGRDIVDIEYGRDFKGGKVKDAKTEGGRQAFALAADGKGYVQEIAVPWKLLTKGGGPLKAGDTMLMTVEPNFTIGTSGRLTIKDLFRAGVTPDRVFTFRAYKCWGAAMIEPKGNVAPQALRLADAREFPVRMEKGLPVVDWTGLVKAKELPGFKPIAFTMPQDGYVSLNIKIADGQVVRQLLACAFMAKGKHEVKWDGLATWSWTRPGGPVPPGRYTWSGIYHTGLGLRLRGWAHNSGRAPWDDGTGTSNWGGDHGLPCACAADGGMVFLGWNGAEAGQAVVATNLQANVKWRNTRFSMTGVTHVAADAGTFYAAARGTCIYRLDAKTGAYTTWEGTNSPDAEIKGLWPDPAGRPEKLDGLDAAGGRLFLAFTEANLVAVVDGKTGKLLKTLPVESPGNLKAAGADKVYVVSGGKAVLALNPETGQAKTFADGLANARAVAVDKDGKVYVACREPENQVKVFGPDGKAAGAIGRAGGRALVGKWTPDGMAFASAITIDAAGQLWVAEADSSPKRISVWDTKSGQLVRELFGATAYGAGGGAISPLDPNIMVGNGCEWRIDPATGRATCTAVITRAGMSNSRFAVGSNGRLYLVSTGADFHAAGTVTIYERLGDADYRPRTVISYEKGPDPKDKTGKRMITLKTILWADENGDGERQDGEVTSAEGEVRVSAWYMSVTPDLSLYAGDRQFKVTGFTACSAPKYDLAGPVKMPVAGLGSADGRLVLKQGAYGVDHGEFVCHEIASGKLLWTYPDNFVGVHGSHRAPPPQVGLVRGSFGPCGAGKLPPPVGDVWVIATNVGEWHILTGEGYYLARLFQGDPLKVQWPAQAVPGAVLDNCPPGSGGEDFGGSIACTKDGRLFLQAGKTGFWNVEVVGLDTVKALPGGGEITITEADTKEAQAIRDGQLQATVGTRRATVKKMTPAFTGNIAKDFQGAEIIEFKKQDDAAVHAAAAWDETNLYLAWDVRDRTAWQNAAGLPEFIYCKGDSVDFQLATDPKAKPDRGEAVLGDLRLAIANFKGTPTAVLYRKVAKVKTPKVFSSGVVREYPMESVTVVAEAKIEVRKRGDGYTVEAAVPLAVLDLRPADGLVLRGDFGATHGDPGGQDTVLRTYWNNQHTGIVNDEVFELQMEPKNWGELIFKQ